MIRSQEFEKLDDPDKIRKKATNLVKYIRNFGERDSIEVSELEASLVVEEGEDGTEHAYIQPEPAKIRMTAPTAQIITRGKDGETEVFLPADRTEEWTQLALRDEKVGDLANLLDRGDDWVNLYRIYEFIQDNIESEDNIVEQGWWSKSEKDRFKQTANSRDAIGDNARHANNRIPAPNNPMTQAEAKRQIDSLVDQWLEHRKQIAESVK
ncbi:hypothetical protein [Halobacterium salinarum]|uniref:Uncharacterized protein n=1 Tax=Halobacterium salinarum (strain ATCC 33171 / DSM 3754 / JCM 8978 / NBRC 102687 / NCIMB 764 / 91-R6) TaxID=2597657 RepID=A0A4D6GYB2_HALS9|nr:hypothetical protein [Halobacterium salinarum]QCC46146.1 uncharacterized protein HBSAL_13170 [Halobacterium salinarum]